MVEVKWIKIVTDIFDDEKMLMIESLPDRDGIIVIWFKLLCLAGKQNNSGVFMFNDRIPYTDEMLSTIFRRPLNTVRLALKTFEEYGMIEIVNNTITIPKWEKHQQLDSLELAREQTRKRVEKYREKQKELTCNVTGNVTECVTVTQCNADRIDKDKIRLDIDYIYGDDKSSLTPPTIEKPVEKLKRFIKPTVEEVRSYCNERKNCVNAEKFVDYYESNGWKVGKNPMKDWKAAVRTWEKNGYSNDKQDKSETDIDKYKFVINKF